jgi:Asp-tRNA(Asn)/Glu-tRNA(Gln) amidotransferase A subunit family amidase
MPRPPGHWHPGGVSLATTSDGGELIRIPASFIGAYGLKPIFGLVPVGPTEMLPWLDTAVYGPPVPVGLQTVGPRHADSLVLRASIAYKRARPWNGHWPVQP